MTAPTREVLEDRYRGITWQMTDTGEYVEPTELWHSLSEAVSDLVVGTARCHPDDAAPLVEEAMTLVRRTIIDRLSDPSSDGMADPHPWAQAAA